MTSSATDAVVIGAGVIGSAVTLELARRGLRVVAVDKLPAAGYGSTSSSSAVVRFNYSTRAGVAMAYEGLHYWLRWPEHVGEIGGPLVEYVNVPMLQLMDDGEEPKCLGYFSELGLKFEVLSHDEVTTRFPAFDLRRFGPPVPLDDHDAAFWGEPADVHDRAIVMPEAGYISDPQLSAQNLSAAAIAAGAEFRFKTEVVSIDRNDGGDRVAGVTFADGSRIDAPVVVNVAGPHSSNINELAAVTADMGVSTKALRREVFVVPAPSGVEFETDGAMIGDMDIGVYFRPERGNNVLIGSAEPECDVLEWIDDPDVFNESMTEDEYQLLVLRTSRRVTDLGVPQTKRGLVSLYDATADWTPIYDRSSLDGYYMAIGTSGNQFKNAAIAGHCMAELITAVEGGHDHDVDPVVVTGKYTGMPIDLGTFSRLRTIDADSPSSVLG